MGMIYTLYQTEITVDRPIESSVDQTVKSNMDTTNKKWIQPLSDPAPQGDDTSDTAAAAVSDTQPNVSKEHFRGKPPPLLPPVHRSAKFTTHNKGTFD